MANSKILTERVKIEKLPFFIRDMRRLIRDKFVTEMPELLNLFDEINVTFLNELSESFTDFVALVYSCINKHDPLIPASIKK